MKNTPDKSTRRTTQRQRCRAHFSLRTPAACHLKRFGTRTLLGALVFLAVGGCASNGTSVSFWPTQSKPPANVLINDHPCGQVLTIQTNVVPRGEKWLKADAIHEIDESGQILRTWNVPIDHYPVGVHGDKVLLAYGSTPHTVMTVTVDGHIGVINSSPVRYLDARACPASINKGYLCSVVTPEPLRMLAYSPVCT